MSSVGLKALCIVKADRERPAGAAPGRRVAALPCRSLRGWRPGVETGRGGTRLCGHGRGLDPDPAPVLWRECPWAAARAPGPRRAFPDSVHRHDAPGPTPRADSGGTCRAGPLPTALCVWRELDGSPRGPRCRARRQDGAGNVLRARCRVTHGVHGPISGGDRGQRVPQRREPRTLVPRSAPALAAGHVGRLGTCSAHLADSCAPLGAHCARTGRHPR